MEHSITIPGHTVELGRNLYQLQQNGVLCDVGLQCKDGVIQAHKLILMSCGSPYLYQQVTKGSSDTSKCYVNVTDYTVNIVSILIHGLYTGHMKIFPDNVSEFINLCQFLGLKKFESSIKSFDTNEQCSAVGNTHIPCLQNNIVSVGKEQQPDDLFDPEKLWKIEIGTETNTIEDCDISESYETDFDNSNLGILNSDNNDDHINSNSSSKNETIKRKQTSPILNFQKRKKDMAESDRSLSSVSESENDLHLDTDGDTHHVDNSSGTFNIHVSHNSNSSQTCKICKQPFLKDENETKDHDKSVDCKECMTLYSADHRMTRVKQRVKADIKTGCKNKISTVKTQCKSYSVDAYNAAYEAIVNKEMSVRAAARMYNVPPGTLNYRLQRKKKNLPEVKRGTKTVFNEDQAEKLTRCFKILIKLGYRYTVEQFCEIASHYAVCLGKRKREQQLAKHWFYLFIENFPKLKELRDQLKTELDDSPLLSAFFTYFSTSLSEYSLQEKPDLIYSFAAIELSCKPPYIVKKETLCENTGNEDTVTLLVCGNGTGDVFPPYFILPESITGLEILQRDCTQCIFHVAEDNLYNTEIFLNYLQTYFIRNAPETSKILLVDGHNLFLSVEAFDWTEKNKVILVLLPAESSRTLQPIENVCHNHFEEVFNAECKQRTEPPSTRVKIEDLCKSARIAYGQAFTKDRLKQAFSSTGIFPLNKDIAK